MDAGTDLEDLTPEELEALEQQLAQERKRREDLAKALEEANTLSLKYHQQAPKEYHDNIPIWDRPLVPLMGYPPGSYVWHNEQGWHTTTPEVNMTEPGTPDSTWTSFEESGIAIPNDPEED